jgi:hypothetical protein
MCTTNTRDLQITYDGLVSDESYVDNRAALNQVSIPGCRCRVSAANEPC